MIGRAPLPLHLCPNDRELEGQSDVVVGEINTCRCLIGSLRLPQGQQRRCFDEAPTRRGRERSGQGQGVLGLPDVDANDRFECVRPVVERRNDPGRQDCSPLLEYRKTFDEFSPSPKESRPLDEGHHGKGRSDPFRTPRGLFDETLRLIELVGFEVESAQGEEGIEEAHMVLNPGPARHIGSFLCSLTGKMQLSEFEHGPPSNSQQDGAGDRVGNGEPAVAGGDGRGRLPVVEVGSGGDDRELVNDEVRARLHARNDVALKCDGGFRFPTHPVPVRGGRGHPEVEGALPVSIVAARLEARASHRPCSSTFPAKPRAIA